MQVLTVFVPTVSIDCDIAAESVLGFYVARLELTRVVIRIKPSYRDLSVEEKTLPAANHPMRPRSLLPSISYCSLPRCV